MRFKIMRRIAHAVGFTGFLCFLLIVLTEIGTGRNDPTTIRVAIIKGKKVVRITATGEFEIWDEVNERKIINSSPGKVWRIVSAKSEIQIEGVGKCGDKLIIRSLTPGEAILDVNGNRYRGEIVVTRDRKGRLIVINELDIEEYLYGVVSREISPNWPLEAAKAQAVAARTFALYQKFKFRQLFDLDDTVNFQIYGGFNYEHPRINQAIQETRGQVLVYNGELAAAYFHANCGGATEDSENIWSVSFPYLRGQPCGFCENSSHSRWVKKFSKKTLQNILYQQGYPIGTILSIRPVNFSPTGRVKTLEIFHSQGKKIMPAAKFQNLVGSQRLRSLWFAVENTDSHFIFKGKGWGHGVGMCQEGSRKMAELGFNYQSILNYYYLGTSIGDLQKIFIK